jgi:CheY-like chemotaxis protein
MTEQKQSRKVLVVDDDPDVVDQVSMVLRGRGFEVLTAASQAEGEELLLRTQPDLCVCDLMMEEMDSGFILVHTAKKLYPDLPVVLLTGVQSATRLSFRSQDPRGRSWVQADAVLDKPVRPEELSTTIERLIG